MRAAETRSFEADPLFASKIRLRMWDEAAKRTGHSAPPLDTYADLVRQHME